MAAMNQYEDESGRPVLKPALVCYADILGWSSEIERAAKEGRSDEHLCLVRTALREAFANVRSTAKSLFDAPSPPLFDVKVFTDNIVAAFQTASLHEDRGEPALSLMLTVFSRLQMDLVQHGLLLRGGVGFGLHYMDEDFAYGPALPSILRLGGRAPLHDPVRVGKIRGRPEQEVEIRMARGVPQLLLHRPAPSAPLRRGHGPTMCGCVCESGRVGELRA